MFRGHKLLDRRDRFMKKEYHVDILGAPQDISQEVNTWVQKGLPNGQ